MSNIADREVRAESEFECYDFGEVGIEGTLGWEYTTPGNTWSRTVYLANESGGASHQITFTVVFAEGSDSVAEAYAIDHAGVIFGKRPAQPEAVPMRLTIDITLLRRPGPFENEASALEWIRACLNCNTNHVVATVEAKA